MVKEEWPGKGASSGAVVVKAPLPAGVPEDVDPPIIEYPFTGRLGSTSSV